jgi:hypothetical protein
MRRCNDTGDAFRDDAGGNQLTHLEQRHNTDCSPEALHSTMTLLTMNPDYYTVWNYRRTMIAETKRFVVDRKALILHGWLSSSTFVESLQTLMRCCKRNSR